MHFRKFGYDWAVWAIFVAVPLAVFWQSATSLKEQGVASGGPMQNAAIFPKSVAAIMMALAAINFVRIFLGHIAKQSAIKSTATTFLALICTGIFFLYLNALSQLGYYIATPMLLAVIMRLFGINWLGSVVAAITMTIAVAGVFEGLLNVVLPLGITKLTLFG